MDDGIEQSWIRPDNKQKPTATIQPDDGLLLFIIFFIDVRA